MDASTTLLYGIILLHLLYWINNWYSCFTKIKQEGQPAVDAWLETLKAGGSQSPIELAKIAGVDITTDAPLKATIKYISDLVNEAEQLTNEIEQQD